MIDTSLWERDIKIQASGTRTKFWLNSPVNNHKYLFKVPTEGTGGHWAEYIASKLGSELGFNTVETELAVNDGVIGTVSKNFRADSEEFFEGGDLFLAEFRDFDRFSLTHYELPNILELLSAYNLEKDFVDLPIFDALIANNDRHCDNWGVVSSTGGYRLAPIYDNGSSLGFNTSKQDVRKMLTDNRMMQGFCNRGKSLIGLPNRKKPKHLELLTVLYDRFSQEIETVLQRLNNMDEGMLYTIIEDISNDIMDDLNKEWVVRLLIYRKDWLFNWYERSVIS